MSKNITIIGAGLTGILIANFLNKKKFNISLVESNNNLGGFLNSLKYKNHYFDFGTHFLRETGINKIDNKLFNIIRNKWLKFKVMPSGNFYNGKLNNNNQFIDIRSNKERNLILRQILKKKKPKYKFLNEEIRCNYFFGKIITNKIIKPIVKKYTSLRLNQLKPFTCNKFALGRFIVNDRLETIQLKKNSFLDKRIAHTFYKDGIKGMYNFYPKKGGISNFVDFFLPKNIKIFKNEKIRSIKIIKNKISSIELNNKIIKSDYVFCTINKNNFLNLCNLEKEKKKLTFINWCFVNILSNKMFNSNCYYVNIHDSKTYAYRITLYDNIQKNLKKKNYRATIEFVGMGKELINDKIINEVLLKAKLINKNFKIKKISSFQAKLPIPNKHERHLIPSSKNNNLKNTFFYNNSLFEGHGQETNIIRIFNEIKKFNEKKNYNE